MPSTVVHIGFAALIGVGLLGTDFDRRAALVVAGVTAFPDLDTFLGLVMRGAHRAALHNVVLPTAVLVALYWDVRLREDSFVVGRWGERGYRVGWVSVMGGWLVAGVLLDAFYNGTNLLWPLHDEFIDLSGNLLLSNERGVVQTFIEFDGFAVAEEHSVGTTEDTHYYTGVDPGPDAPDDVERIFPIFETGELALVSLTGYAVATYSLWSRNPEADE